MMTDLEIERLCEDFKNLKIGDASSSDVDLRGKFSHSNIWSPTDGFVPSSLILSGSEFDSKFDDLALGEDKKPKVTRRQKKNPGQSIVHKEVKSNEILYAVSGMKVGRRFEFISAVWRYGKARGLQTGQFLTPDETLSQLAKTTKKFNGILFLAKIIEANLLKD